MHLRRKCATMKQSVGGDRVFGTMLDDFPALARRTRSDPVQRYGWNRAGERLDRLKQLGIDNTRRHVRQIEGMIADFDRMVNTLMSEIQVEQDRTGIHDSAHFAYSTSARAMTQRRDNLNRSIDELKRQLADAKVALERSSFCREGPTEDIRRGGAP
jgi:hypothetical protein